jgi:ESS family glutamate:Na+ symporter
LPVTVFQIDQMDMLSLSILVLFVGMYINRKVRLLRENYIPPAVTGGLIFSTGATLLYIYGGIELDFDLRLRDLLLLVFFSTVGLSAQLRTLITGGKALAILVAVAAVFLIVQDAIGIGLALLTGNHPGYGLMAGSVSWAGGHGTAIAWGKEAAAAGLAGAEEIGVIFATFGLICGGLLGGPIARNLMKRHGLEGRTARELSAETVAQAPTVSADQLYNILRTLMILAICVSLGDIVNRYLFSRGTLLPGFLTSMFVAIAITNVIDVAKHPLNRGVVDGFGQVCLSIFLSMSMMSIQLWVLAGGARTIMLVLALQVLVMTFFASFVVFRVMGRNYDAVVMASGFAGLGLGATPVAIANMDAVTQRYGPSPQAFLVIPLVGAFFIDLLNATVIKMFIQFISSWSI